MRDGIYFAPKGSPIERRHNDDTRARGHIARQRSELPEEVNYPASKQDLVEAARRNNAPQEVLDIIRGLPCDNFGGPQDVMKAYGQET